ncbi:MAG: hypothetical protein ACRDIE_04975, partial [Chloroflexota bacterium]
MSAPLVSGVLTALPRTKPELILENALLRQQVIILRRSVKRPHCTPSRLHTWRQALLIIQPETLLRWHRKLFRRFWRRQSRATGPAHRPPIAPEILCPGREGHPCRYRRLIKAAVDWMRSRAVLPTLVTAYSECPMFAELHQRLADAGRHVAQFLRRRLLVATKPAAAPPLAGTLADLVRSRPELIAENALLRQQVIILRRGVKRPRCTPTDRTLLVLLASRLRTWRAALLIVQPDTLLRWHRELFRRFWRRKSRTTTPAHRPPIAPETGALIREMTAANRSWGAERIRGELLKLNVRVAKSTIQRYMRGARPPRRSGQTWATFLANHGKDIWAADFLPITDLLFRQMYAFFVLEIASRRVVHV